MNVLFFGTPGFSVPTLRTLLGMPGVRVGAVITQPDRPAGRGGKLSQSPVKELAVEHHIPVLQPRSLRRELHSVTSQLSAYEPFDIGVVIAFGQLLPQEILALPRCGCVNIHASLLPRWRGAAPIQRALAAGDRETGVCLMQMEVGLDTGAVFCETRTPITAADTGESLHDKLSQDGAALISKHLAALCNHQLTPLPQPTEGITYASKITTEECRIDWNASAQQIALTVRAFAPHPGCFSFWRGKRLKILFARPAQNSGAKPTTPGSIINARHGQLEVQCGVGSLLVEQLQLEGKKKMASDEFLRGTGLTEGELLTTP
jgi:methionyl-tRNA formyltransferase